MNPDLPVVSARNLSKQFGAVQAVSNLDLDVPRACIYGFLGPNGSGKSTTIRMLCGLLMPSAGSVSVLNLSVPQDSAKLKSRIGYMTQTFSLFSDLTIRENLDFVARIYGVQGSERRRRVSELEARYDLEARSGQLAGTLSGGQKQRLALACSVVHRPELLLLDEPTSAVDPRSRRDFWACLFELVEAGTTILVSTHYMDEAERCHRLAILDQGKKVADGSPPDLKRQTQVQVVEVHGQEPEKLQRLLLSADQVISVTQLGVRLRVLVPVSLSDPEALVTGLINQRAGDNSPEVTTRLVEPSLEDVFVVVTDHVGGAPL